MCTRTHRAASPQGWFVVKAPGRVERRKAGGRPRVRRALLDGGRARPRRGSPARGTRGLGKALRPAPRPELAALRAFVDGEGGSCCESDTWK